MARRTPAELYAAARSAGLSSARAVLAVAIALGESSGDDTAVGDVSLQNGTWGPSVGVWQIRTLKAQTGTGSDRDIVALQGNLARQALAMSHISGGGGNFTPWTVYTSGKYMQFLSQAQASAVGGSSALPVTDTSLTPASAGGLDAVAAQVVAASKNVAVKIAAASLGLALVGAGIWLAVAPKVKSTMQTVQRTTAKAAKAVI